MSADNRKVATDALETLGSIIDDQAGRDAIHLAVEPVVAGQRLSPGQDVGFLADGTVGDCDEPLGIVDPFLSSVVRKGQRFWLVVYPRKITSLRHVWSHPGFRDETVKPGDLAEKNRSEVWMRQFANQYGVTLGRIMEYAERYVDHGDYWWGGQELEGESVPGEFWDHYEVISGKPVKSSDRGSFFSCSC